MTLAAPTSFNESLAAALAASGERTLLQAGTCQLTGGDLCRHADRYANALFRAGVRSGDRVAVQAEKSVELVFLYLGVLRLGAVYLPLNTAYRRGEVEFILADAAPRVFVCDPADVDMFQTVAGAHGATLLSLAADGTGSLARLASEAQAPAPRPELGGHSLAAIVYTSGTTGKPKGAMVTQANLLSNARALIAAWGIGPEDILLHTLPLYHIHGLFVALNTVLLAGGRILLQPRFEVEAVLDGLRDATLFMGVPTYYARLLADPRFGTGRTGRIRLFVAGSAPLTTATFHEFEARTGHRILERYGMSECGIICSNLLDGRRLPGSVGPPLPGVAVRAALPDGTIAGPDEVGVLEVRGPNVFAGYWRQPERTQAEFQTDGYFITGDLATIDADGVVRIVGRAKDLIICGGLNVYPKEIEALIDTLDGVDESAVIGLPHADFGEAVAAIIRMKPGCPPLSKQAVIAAVRAELASFKAPKAVFFTDELPRNAMGKVQKALLRDRYAGAAAA